MADFPRKKSADITCNSPYSGTTAEMIPLVHECARSRQTHRSRYSNQSKLTKSQLFQTLSRGTREKQNEKIKERDI